MSMQYCEHCQELIDTDYNAEHFEENEQGETLCEEEQNSEPQWLLGK